MTNTCIHGNLIQINGKGILITGKPGVGKSSFSLACLEKGHQFICDDLVIIKKRGNVWFGYHPKTEDLKHVMHIRDTGFIDLKTKYKNQLLESTKIHILIELVRDKHNIPRVQIHS